MLDEKRVAGASYILTFFKDVEALTNHNAQYLNLLLEIQNKVAKIDDKLAKLSEEEKTVIIGAIQNYRYFANKCYIQYKSLQTFVKSIKENVDIEKYYDEIKKSFVLSRETCEKLVIEFNKVLLEDVIKNLLESSEEYINSIYGEMNTENA